jgi:hypothetical protein
MRQVRQRLIQELPADLDGILGRAGPLLEGQDVHLDRLGLLDLDGPVDSATDVAHALLRAQQLPRMILALGEVMIQQEKDEVLRPLQRDALELARELADVAQLWIYAHRDELDLDEL